MTKLYTILAICALTLALVSAEPPRYRTSRRNGQLRTNIRFLARQEEEVVDAAPADPAPTPDAAPYPPAGVTPEIPFEEAPAAATPDQTYGPPAEPDNTYGPPPPAAAEPDNTYGPPAAVDAAADAPAIEEPAAELIQPRSKAAIRQRVRPLPIRLVALPAPAAPRLSVVEIIRSEPVLTYTLQ